MRDDPGREGGRRSRWTPSPFSDEQMVRLMMDLGLTEEQARAELEKSGRLAGQPVHAQALRGEAPSGSQKRGLLARLFGRPRRPE